MDEKTKNILSYVISILIVVGITTCFVIDTRTTLTWFLDIVLAALSIFVPFFTVFWLKELLYDFFDSDYFEEMYRKYISKHYINKYLNGKRQQNTPPRA